MAATWKKKQADAPTKKRPCVIQGCTSKEGAVTGGDYCKKHASETVQKGRVDG